MKRLIIVGAGQMGRAAAALINDEVLQLAAFGDNASRGTIRGIPVLSVAEALSVRPDIVCIAVAGKDRERQLEQQVLDAGFQGKIILLSDFMQVLDIRKAVLLRLAERLTDVDGAVAELGVYRGDFARVLNELFPQRRLYLFDTFSGFHHSDLEKERIHDYSNAAIGDFSDTSIEIVLHNMPYPEHVIIRNGYFPETTDGLDESFALVSIDADLYRPTYEALCWFMPHMARGGALIVHDWDSKQFLGVRKAVDTYEQQHGRLMLMPVGDMHGTAVIMKA